MMAIVRDNEFFTEHFTILIEFIKSIPIISERMHNFSEFIGFMNGNHLKTFFPIIKETLAEFITQIEQLSDFGSQMHVLYFLIPSIKIGFNPELCAEVASDMQGYYQKPEEAAKAVGRDGYKHKRDIGILDEDGYLRIVDRTKDERTSELKRGSMKVKFKLLPSLVEDFNHQISALLSTILTKLETSEFNEKVAAIFVEFLETIVKTPFMDLFLPQLKLLFPKFLLLFRDTHPDKFYIHHEDIYDTDDIPYRDLYLVVEGSKLEEMFWQYDKYLRKYWLLNFYTEINTDLNKALDTVEDTEKFLLDNKMLMNLYPNILYNKARIYLAKDNLDLARSFAEKAWFYYEDREIALYKLMVEIYSKLEEWEILEDFCFKAYLDDYHNPELFSSLYFALLKRNSKMKASELRDRVIKYYPDYLVKLDKIKKYECE